VDLTDDDGPAPAKVRRRRDSDVSAGAPRQDPLQDLFYYVDLERVVQGRSPYIFWLNLRCAPVPPPLT